MKSIVTTLLCLRTHTSVVPEHQGVADVIIDTLLFLKYKDSPNPSSDIEVMEMARGGGVLCYFQS
jgi:hypothetical protein